MQTQKGVLVNDNRQARKQCGRHLFGFFYVQGIHFKVRNEGAESTTDPLQQSRAMKWKKRRVNVEAMDKT